MGRPRYVSVLFARGIAKTPLQRAIHLAIRLISRSPIVHCAVASDGIVINPSFKGIVALDQTDFARRYPSLVWSIHVPVATLPDLIAWHEYHNARFRIIRSAIRGATFGLVPSKDCVHTVIEILASVGVVVPRRITTPAAMFDWLRAQGYELHDLDKRPVGTGNGDWSGMLGAHPASR